MPKFKSREILSSDSDSSGEDVPAEKPKSAAKPAKAEKKKASAEKPKKEKKKERARGLGICIFHFK